MSIVKAFLSFLGRNLRIEVTKAHELVDKCDADKDGYISVSELWTIIHSFAVEARK